MAAGPARSGSSDESAAPNDPRLHALAPEPDFRNVTLVACTRAPLPWALAGMSIAAVVGVAPTFGWREAACAGIVGASGVVLSAMRAKPASTARDRATGRGRAVAMSIVPWGIIIDEGDQTRVLRWGAIERVEVMTRYGRDQASDLTKGSLVVIDTQQERLYGRAPDEVSLERLIAHREAYAREAAHVASIDLEGERAAGESWEPQVERLLLTSSQMLRGGGGPRPDGAAFAMSVLGYRGKRSTLPSEEVASRLRAVLRDRVDRARDPRPLGAILAAELRLTSLAGDVAQLVASPHPLTAATARAAGIALGLPKSRLGVLDEVAPFLPEADVEALAAWSSLPCRVD